MMTIEAPQKPRSTEELIERAALLKAEIARRETVAFTLYTKPDYEVNWHHRLVGAKLDAVLDGKIKRLIILEPPQNGKALAVETPIPTPGGWRCIGDLQPGEFVFDVLGQPTQVVGVSPVWKRRRVYQVSVDSGQSLVADGAHEWVVSTCGKHRERLTRWETQALAARQAQRNVAVLHHPGLALPDQQLPIDPYTLGAWLGDGASGVAVITGTGEDGRWIRQRIQAAYQTSDQSTPNTFGILGLRTQLRLLRLLDNKHVPTQYVRAGSAQRLALLQGLIDTDGYVSPTGQIEFSSTKRCLAEAVRELVVSLGAKASLLEKRASIYGRDCGPAYRVLFYLAEAASIPRKAVLCRDQTRPDHFLTLEDAGESDTVCIEVASPHHLFLAGMGMVPTCNSEQVSRRFPALALGRNPNRRIIACSYNDSLAQDMSRDVQKIMSTKEYAVLFPHARLAEARDEEKRTQGYFDVVGGKGYYIGVGIMGSMTGKTSDIGIVDDPFKNRAEAESETFRDRVWDQYQSSFAQRQFGSDGAIIICQTRWHEDDLVGRLLAQAKNVPHADQWEVVSLPAIAETREKYREVGDALWPAKYPLTTLMARRAGLGEYDWSALFQQRPAPSGGGLFKEEWFAGRFLEVAPALMRVARGWDTAGTELDGDYTCGVKIGEEFLKDETTGEVKSTGRFIVLDVVRKQLGPAGVAALMSVTTELDGACAQREEKEGGAAGLAVINTRTKEMAGKDYAGVQISGSKITRSKPFRQQCEAGNVYLLRAEWNTEYVKELCGFPTAKHDDQVDGSSCAFNAVLLEEPPTPEWVTW